MEPLLWSQPFSTTKVAFQEGVNLSLRWPLKRGSSTVLHFTDILGRLALFLHASLVDFLEFVFAACCCGGETASLGRGTVHRAVMQEIRRGRPLTQTILKISRGNGSGNTHAARVYPLVLKRWHTSFNYYINIEKIKSETSNCYCNWVANTDIDVYMTKVICILRMNSSFTSTLNLYHFYTLDNEQDTNHFYACIIIFFKI